MITNQYTTDITLFKKYSLSLFINSKEVRLVLVSMRISWVHSSLFWSKKPKTMLELPASMERNMV